MKKILLISLNIILAASSKANTITSSIECNGTYTAASNGWNYRSNCTISTNLPSKSIIQKRDEFEDKPTMYRLDIRDEKGSKRSSIFFKCDASTENYSFSTYVDGGSIKVRFDENDAYDLDLMDFRQESLWKATNGKSGVDYSDFDERNVTKFIDDIAQSKVMRTKAKYSTYKYDLTDYNSKIKQFTNLCREMKNNMD
ncbi:hypothetical protein AB3Y13_20325 [Vibrio alginolyticus]|uniref:hypothetical protein n=1 Tax=Vibrio intestinalis TaxID=2933291 RepID=UPI0021A29DE5|nr:hypothetical protein [Vibrio intestinalis]